MAIEQAQVKDQIREFILRDLASAKGVSSFSDSESLMESGVIDSLGIFRLVAFLASRRPSKSKIPLHAIQISDPETGETAVMAIEQAQVKDQIREFILRDLCKRKGESAHFPTASL